MRLVFILLTFLTAVTGFTASSNAMDCSGVHRLEPALIRLYEGNYVANVSQISPGTVVEFSDHAKFQIKKTVSISSTDLIFLTQKYQILRIPKNDGITINQYVDGYGALIEAGIPVPKIISHKRGERILVEEIDIQFHLEDLFLNQHNLQPVVIEKMKNEFMGFVSKFRDFNAVSDIHANQIVYAKNRGWMLLDWRDMHMFGNLVNPFYPVWESIKFLAKMRGLEADQEMIKQWSLDSDRAIAYARAQQPENYYDMTFKRRIELLHQ